MPPKTPRLGRTHIATHYPHLGCKVANGREESAPSHGSFKEIQIHGDVLFNKHIDRCVLSTSPYNLRRVRNAGEGRVGMGDGVVGTLHQEACVCPNAAFVDC